MSKIVYPDIFFRSTHGLLSVDINIASHFDLSPCADDVRRPQLLVTLDEDLLDERIIASEEFGGIDSITKRLVTLPQVMNELQAAFIGAESIFTKDGVRHVFYVDNRKGWFFYLNIWWDDSLTDGEAPNFCINPEFFNEQGDRTKGSKVYGNSL